jgi:uncharacterized membrane protein
VLGWVLFGVLLGVAGLAVLALLTVRLYRQVRRLGRDVSAAGARLAAATEQLERATPRR